MFVRLVKSGKWNPPVGTRGRGACPHTEDAEEVEDLLTDILSKSAVDPGSDPERWGWQRVWWSPCHQHWGQCSQYHWICYRWGCGYSGTSHVGLHWWGNGLSVAGGAGANGAVIGGGGKEYGGGGTPIRIGVIMGGGGKFNCGGYWIGFRV